MPPNKKAPPTTKDKLHPRSKHRSRYDFKALVATSPALARYVQVNPYGDTSINFFDPAAVKALNKALLQHYYGIQYWDIPENYLCPPIPGRADYVHYAADLLAGLQNGVVPEGKKITCLDVGVGANCIYPIIGAAAYGWSFVGSDIAPASLASAQKIIELNPMLRAKVVLRLQQNASDIFHGIMKKGEQFDLTLCNPPFHASVAEAQAGTLRKLQNLQQKKAPSATLNFGGQHNELWCSGGEVGFLRTMVAQSRAYADSCLWFTSLVSKEQHLKSIYAALKQAKATNVKTIKMGQGNKVSRLVAWSFLTPPQHQAWVAARWHNKA